ncbi:hypothetical protein QQS21_007921 [Conoideocrella luteorostrata]|uniref:Calcineurin-like phosphoesterase domain-containing protein n=1 Tax=Conoideocrella luteorostrata TaxID=1105319 RepID=A0AAJ0CJT0_9HYPO|nr:hypothetical protein QQS21_007921 [Conoideocrella luteorostrata]
MRLPITSSALAACLLGIAAADLDHQEIQRSLEARTWAHETRSGLGDIAEMLKTCDGCQNILGVLKGIVAGGDETFISLGKQLCQSGTDYDEQFCDGVVEREAPTIASIVRTMEAGSPSSIQFCVSFLGVCDVPKVDEWSVSLPAKESCAAEGKAVSGKKPLQVIQYSDIHIDPLYEEGASTKCKKPTCCRPSKKGKKAGHERSPAGPFGDHKCDTPVTLEKSMYEFIKSEFPKAAFALFTGDIVDHGLYNTSKSYNEDLIKHTYGMMHEHVDVVYGTAGNHEAHPPNIFEPQSVGNDTQWVYDSLAKEWSRWVSNSSLVEAKAVGAYSTKYPKGNLRVISLNTNMYYRFNFILYQRALEKDPNGQFAWLVKELDAAEKAGENVYIIGHMSFGVSDTLPNSSNYFDQIVKRYSSTIKAMFFGHTHVDHFEISYSNYAERSHANALAVSYICPSLTPTSGNPSFRVYDVDPETFAVIDAHTYIADMEDKGFQPSGPLWKRYYSAKDVYGHATSPQLIDSKAELSPAFWHNVTVALEKNETVFDQYMSRKSRGWKDKKKCRGHCMKEEICALRAARSQDNCWKPKPGVNFSKRDATDHNHGQHDECGVSVSAEWLSALVRREDMLEMVQERFLEVGGKVQPIVKRAEPVLSSSSSSSSSAAHGSTQTAVDCKITGTPSGTVSTGDARATPSTKGNGAGELVPGAIWVMIALAALAL